MTKDSKRIMSLEEEVSHLALANEELSTEVLAQWKRIEQLEKKLVHLETRLNTFEDNQDAPPEDTKPPHW
ncbi:MAG: SlyX family protein [Rhizobiaceae bacterium]